MKRISLVEFGNKSENCTPDNNIENWFQNILLSNQTVFEISSDIQLLRLRIGVKEKQISPFMIRILETDEGVQVLPTGKLADYPKQLSVYDDLLERILT